MQFSTWRTVWPNLKLLGNRPDRILPEDISRSFVWKSYFLCTIKIFVSFTEFNAINIYIFDSSIVYNLDEQFFWNYRGSRNVFRDILANFEEFRNSFNIEILEIFGIPWILLRFLTGCFLEIPKLYLVINLFRMENFVNLGCSIYVDKP